MSSVIEPDTDRAALLTDFVLADLQLSQQPFASEPDGGEWFIDEIADAQLEDIKQALVSGDDLLLILGPEGSGKSTLLAQLGVNSGQRIQCFSVRGSDRFSTQNLFAGMLEAFKKTPSDDLKLMLDDLIPSLQGMADHNTLGAIVLDDAHNIPKAELTKLLSGMLYINSSDENLLRVVLAAPTEFEEQIPELLPEGADLPYSSLAIEAFDKDRTAHYLDYRFQRAGATGGLPFTDREVAEINEDAAGRPGDLHAVAAQHLNIRDESYVAELPPELAEKKSRGLGGLGGAKMLKELQRLADEKATAAGAGGAATTVVAENANATKQPELDAQAKAEAAKAEAQLQAKLEREAAEKEKLAKEEAAKQQAAKEAADKAAKEKAAKALADQKAADEAKAEAEAAKQQTASLTNLESPNWILVQNPALFTVQMSAATDRKSVESFLAQNELEAPNSIFSFNRGSVTWYALVHGLYNTIEEAQKDIERMPAATRKNQPWIRAVGRIQNSLKSQ